MYYPYNENVFYSTRGSCYCPSGYAATRYPSVHFGCPLPENTVTSYADGDVVTAYVYSSVQTYFDECEGGFRAGTSENRASQDFKVDKTGYYQIVNVSPGLSGSNIGFDLYWDQGGGAQDIRLNSGRLSINSTDRFCFQKGNYNYYIGNPTNAASQIWNVVFKLVSSSSCENKK